MGWLMYQGAYSQTLPSTMRRLTFILVLLTTTTFGQEVHDGLLGTYESTENGFERYSTVVLSKNYRFTYKSGRGGCQVEVKGTWTFENKKLKFVNDKEFLSNETIHYPDLSLTTWTVKKIGIKPDKFVESACVTDDNLHRKR